MKKKLLRAISELIAQSTSIVSLADEIERAALDLGFQLKHRDVQSRHLISSELEFTLRITNDDALEYELRRSTQ